MRAGLGGKVLFVRAAVLVVAAQFALLSGTASAGAGGARARGPALVVTVGGLPSGVAPQVRLAGPGGLARAIRGVRTRLTDLPAGGYVLRVRPARGRGVTWLPAHAIVRFTLRAATKRVGAAYAIGRRDGTAVISARQLIGARPAANGGGTLIVSKRAASDLRPGGFVVAGVTSSTPRGFLGRVVSVSPAGASAVTVKAAAAGVADVLPEGELKLTVASGHRSSDSLERGRSAAASDQQRSFLEHLSCSHGAAATLNGQVSVDLSTQLEARWRLHLFSLPSLDARLAATIREGASLAASVNGATSCTLDETPIGPEIELGTYTVVVGDVPIVFSPVIQFSVDGSVSVSAAAIAQADQSLSADAGLSYSSGQLSRFADFHNSFKFTPPTLSAASSLQGAVQAKLTLQLYGTDYGPDVSVKNGLALDADTTADPWWTLSDTLSSQLGIDLGELLQVKPLTIYHKSFPLIDAGAPFGAGAGGGGAGGTGGTGGPGPPPPGAGWVSIAQAAAALIHDYDKNGDGRVTIDETWSGRNLLRLLVGADQLDANNAQPFVARYDTDHNMQITKAESDAMYADIHAHDPPPPGVTPPTALADAAVGLLTRFDQNGDGVVTAADGAPSAQLLAWQGTSAMDRAALQAFVSNYDADRDTWIIEPEGQAMAADINFHVTGG